MNPRRQTHNQDPTDDRTRPTSSAPARLVPGIAVVVFLVAAGVLTLSTIPTSSARFASSTQSDADISSAVLELDFDEAGGVVAEIPLTEQQVLGTEPIATCADVALKGSTKATANFIATIAGGTGLERYADIRIMARKGACRSSRISGASVFAARLDMDDPGVWVVYEGPLIEVIGALAGRPLPPGAGGGVEILEDLFPGEQLAVGFELSLASSTPSRSTPFSSRPSSSGGLFVDLNFFVEVVA